MRDDEALETSQSHHHTHMSHHHTHMSHHHSASCVTTRPSRLVPPSLPQSPTLFSLPSLSPSFPNSLLPTIPLSQRRPLFLLLSGLSYLFRTPVTSIASVCVCVCVCVFHCRLLPACLPVSVCQAQSPSPPPFPSPVPSPPSLSPSSRSLHPSLHHSLLHPSPSPFLPPSLPPSIYRSLALALTLPQRRQRSWEPMACASQTVRPSSSQRLSGTCFDLRCPPPPPHLPRPTPSRPTNLFYSALCAISYLPLICNH